MRQQPDFATGARPRRPPSWEAGLVGVGLLALVLAGAASWRAREQSAAARARVAEVRREVDQQAARLRALAPAGPAAGRAAAASSPVRVVAAVAALLPADVRLERLTIDYGRGAVLEMGVEARDAVGWDRLLERLERSTDFTDVAPGPEARQAEVRSVIRARWSGAAR